MLKYIKAFSIIVFVVAVCYAVMAQASSGAGRAPLRGEVTGGISGYTVSNLRYQLGEDPALVDAVAFNLDGPANQVLVSFDSPADHSFDCVNTSGSHWVCALDGIKTSEVNEIHLIASD